MRFSVIRIPKDEFDRFEISGVSLNNRSCEESGGRCQRRPHG
jgi:hypothetical protein